MTLKNLWDFSIEWDPHSASVGLGLPPRGLRLVIGGLLVAETEADVNSWYSYSRPPESGSEIPRGDGNERLVRLLSGGPIIE